MTPEQRRKNRRLGTILAIIVFALFVWGFIRLSFL
ncbi:MAG TPA: cytochrome oxidase small assembly protein [Burkholderiaceae bacterium]|nr:cytochrome oxidase small assembly protein [Burkholderiaceae bacterium]